MSKKSFSTDLHVSGENDIIKIQSERSRSSVSLKSK